MSITHYVKCIQITAKDSPNVALALWELENGLTPSGTVVVPGQLTWEQYNDRLLTFTKQQICESLEANWYDGPEERLVPDGWMRFAHEYAKRLPARRPGRKWCGVDPGEGGDDSAWVVGDRAGVLGVTSLKTPDTNSVFGRTCLLVREWGIAWEDVIFDYGGGGKEHVDRFRAGGCNVRGLRFGTIKKELKRSMTLFQEKREVEGETASYTSRRSEMAYEVRMLLERQSPVTDPDMLKAMSITGTKRPAEKPPFGLPEEMCKELCRQLAAVPLWWDNQGRFQLIPKSPPQGRPDDTNNFKARIGRSPDQFDAFCLCVHGMNHEPIRATVGTS